MPSFKREISEFMVDAFVAGIFTTDTSKVSECVKIVVNFCDIIDLSPCKSIDLRGEFLLWGR